ncbi:hypothetical protein CGCS363_v009211 [Colletotrichum siamense]|uniref:uncharacterized protein n=1 Tax=Colletotrichum siamense TaxID=690259 RepID=UPI0018728469|nr:uncharacterized protein CGCS363_v009211 [Colletotrichum siamense]KAF5494185.1 hypothetical protein CGCS363_v009211 [Colletotrichum siamense]
MPSRNSDRHHRDRATYEDDDPYYDDYSYERPRASRRVSRSAHELDSAEAGRSHRRRGRTYDDEISPVRPKTRARSLDQRPPRRRNDSYDSYDDYSDSEDDRRRRRNRSRGRGNGSSRRKDSKVSAASTSRSRLQRRESDKAHIIQAAASAAVVAGAAEAWRMRKDKSSWQKKGMRMATAAAGAGAIAAFKDNNPKDYGKKDAVGATIGGLLMNQFASGMLKK